MAFNSMSLTPKLGVNIADAGFTEPTPVQAQAIPVILQGHDVMACAQTGTGKTAAFVLPIINRLQTTNPPGGKGPRAIILTPTRELAMQVLENINLFTKGMGLKTGLIIGGAPYGKQIKMLGKPVDIVVATPGRMIDHMNEDRINFSRTEVVVLDEADRMLDMGFLGPVQEIIDQTKPERQTLMFSATFSQAVEKVAKRVLTNPTRLALASATTNHKNITQYAIRVKDRAQKQKLLNQLLDDGKVYQAVVFIKTKHGADRMAKTLSRDGLNCAALHGDMRQSARKRVIDKMYNGKLRVLVATDVAARGLDVKNITHVINYDLPQVAEDYVHRIGRTGRAGEKGTAVSLISPQDRGLMRSIEQLMGRRIEYRDHDSTPKGTTRDTGRPPRPHKTRKVANDHSRDRERNRDEQQDRPQSVKTSKPKWKNKRSKKSFTNEVSGDDKPQGKRFKRKFRKTDDGSRTEGSGKPKRSFKANKPKSKSKPNKNKGKPSRRQRKEARASYQ